MVGGARGMEAYVELHCPCLQTSDNFHYHEVMAQRVRDLISQTILDHQLLYDRHGVLDFLTPTYIMTSLTMFDGHVQGPQKLLKSFLSVILVFVLQTQVLS